MININTMDKLEKLHIGSDVDRLENYIAIISYSEFMGNCMVDKDRKKQLLDILKEAKETSELFKYNWNMPVSEKDEFDKLFEEYGRFIGKSILDINDEIIDEFSEIIEKSDEKEKDIFAYALPDGIDIRIIYRKGLYYKAYTYYKNDKGMEITEHIKHLVPYNIQEITNTGLIELQARITMTDASMKEVDISEEDKLFFIVNYLSNEFCVEDIDKFNVKVYKMYCDDPEVDMKTLWDEYELLEETELDIAEHAILRELSFNDIKDAISELQIYFDNYEEKEYDYIDLNICLNDEPENIKININKKRLAKRIYTTTIQGIKWVSDMYSHKPRIEIKPIIVKNMDTINSITFDNLSILHKLDITKGNKIYFYIDYVGNIVVCDNQGKKII